MTKDSSMRGGSIAISSAFRLFPIVGNHVGHKSSSCHCVLFFSLFNQDLKDKASANLNIRIISLELSCHLGSLLRHECALPHQESARVH